MQTINIERLRKLDYRANEAYKNEYPALRFGYQGYYAHKYDTGRR